MLHETFQFTPWRTDTSKYVRPLMEANRSKRRMKPKATLRRLPFCLAWICHWSDPTSSSQCVHPDSPWSWIRSSLLSRRRRSIFAATNQPSVDRLECDPWTLRLNVIFIFPHRLNKKFANWWSHAKFCATPPENNRCRHVARYLWWSYVAIRFFSSWARWCIFMQYSVRFYGLTEVASDVISGKAAENISLDIRVQFIRLAIFGQTVLEFFI